MTFNEVSSLKTMNEFLQTVSTSSLKEEQWIEADNRFFKIISESNPNEVKKILGDFSEIDIFDKKFDALTHLPKTLNLIAYS